ncbi:MAG: lipopolysaccharide export system protein LptA [Candidatus Azotimanducaceae bacterium]|jgi:lipopolysaccharide export system protein LptA
MKIIFISLFCMFLIACGQSNSLKGIYTCDGFMKIEFEFKTDGSGYITTQGSKSTFEYEVDGDNLVMTGNGQTSVLTITGDTLEGDKTVIGSCIKS